MSNVMAHFFYKNKTHRMYLKCILIQMCIVCIMFSVMKGIRISNHEHDLPTYLTSIQKGGPKARRLTQLDRRSSIEYANELNFHNFLWDISRSQ